MVVHRIPTTTEAKFFTGMMIVAQLNMHVYHHNSYANNPAMLRSPKPLVMRDVFLTKANGSFPNPLSAFYVPHKEDCLSGIVMAWALGISAGSAFGPINILVCYVLGGLCSSFAYLFQGQISKTKWNTVYDCNASSKGAWCSLCSLTWMYPSLRLPLTRRTPLYVVTVPYAAGAIYTEYFDTVTERAENVAQLTNWGCIGGLFFGVIFWRVMMLTKADKGVVNKMFNEIEGRVRVKAG